MSQIQRLKSSDRMSQIVTCGEMIYLAGQVAAPGSSVTEQTTIILEQVDSLLAEVGSDKEHILQAIIWLSSMEDFAEMNTVWDNWVAPGHAPARACGGATLATPDYKVEIIITARKR
ncbi:RidA family protein [Phaeobacter gallaeciensis]|uniref:RidA family protein n=1 Tax=Phaeobacter gallaeciensis TaxID=60890 RepID=UPI000BBC1B1B|nr:RidA family protein [Phaeobacter gallaeciensis]ATF19262.1 Putative translation initiation inhibitor, yjgF family [Phaeobacter gallaeciensis]ATF23371.1 Putative translation initiation inhibitor, yjgF family [Phaeobacter gallaeciensis]